MATWGRVDAVGAMVVYNKHPLDNGVVRYGMRLELEALLI